MASVSVQFDAATKHARASVQAQLVAFAKAEHAKVMGADPKPLGFTRAVDGRQGAPEESVKADGVIVYDYRRLDLVARDALRILHDLSPVKSGAYRDSHRLFLDLQPVGDLKEWQPGREISISNTISYAQVIEVGGRGGRKFRIQKGGHVYERAAQVLRRAYRDVADIQFTFRAVIGGSQVDQLTAGTTRSMRGSKGRFVSRGGVRSHNKAEVRWPTITINPAGSFDSRSSR